MTSSKGKNTQIELRYEMIKTNRLMKMRNNSCAGNALANMPVNRSDALYRQAYKGNGLSYLLTGRKVLSSWRITFETMAVDRDTGESVLEPHIVSFEIKEVCSLGLSMITVSKHFKEALEPELDRLNLHPVEINVTIRSFKAK